MRLTLLDRAGPAHAQQLAGLEAALRALGIDAQRRDERDDDAPTVLRLTITLRLLFISETHQLNASFGFDSLMF